MSSAERNSQLTRFFKLIIHINQYYFKKEIILHYAKIMNEITGNACQA